MFRIIHCIIYPCVLLSIIFLFTAILQWRKAVKFKEKNYIKKRNSHLTEKSYRKRLFFTWITLIISIAWLCFASYLSLDLINKDYLQGEGVYIDYYRSRDMKYLEFETEEGVMNVPVLSGENLDDLGVQEGKTYKFTYARRTGVIVEIVELM